MSYYSNPTTCDDDIEDGYSSDDLPSVYRDSSASSSTITLIKVLRTNLTKRYYAPDPDPADRSYPSSGTSSTKSLRSVSFNNEFENFDLNYSNFGRCNTKCKSTSLYDYPPANEDLNRGHAVLRIESPKLRKLRKEYENLCTNRSNSFNSDRTNCKSRCLYDYPPENEVSGPSGVTTTTKSSRITKVSNKFKNLHLDLSDIVDSESTGRFKYTTQPVIDEQEKEDDEFSIKKPYRRNRCKTNFFKAMKSFEKNNNYCNTNNVDKSEYIPTVFGTNNRLTNCNYLRCTLPDANLKSSNLEKQNSSIFSFNTLIKASIPTLNLSFSNLESNWESSICTYSTVAPVNAQEEFKLKVPKATNKIEYLTRNCTFLLINEVRTKKPILILDFDALLIPLPLPGKTWSQYKLKISNFIHSMYPFFNIAIWSATKMTTLVPKLNQLDVFDDEKIEKIMFCLDCTSTITAYVPLLGNTIVKPLEIIWNLYPQFNEKNTIMINEELKKFIFDQYGVPIGAAESDKLIKHYELTMVADFLINYISSRNTFSKFNTQFWKKPWK